MSDKASSRSAIYRRCGHCEKLVSEKTYKEHHRLYFHEGQWITVDGTDYVTSSRESSPFSDTVRLEDPVDLKSSSCSPGSADLDSPCSSVSSELDCGQDSIREEETESVEHVTEEDKAGK